MFELKNYDFTNKTVLEVGTGRGGTTRELVKLAAKYKGAQIITTDVFDGNFAELAEELKEYNVEIIFIKTGGCELEGIELNSVDLVICNYTLCAINLNCGSETIALNRFREVLKPQGVLYIEEEYPINCVDNSMQMVWSRKWRLLRALNTGLGELQYNEIKPEIMENILKIIGFKDISYEKMVNQILGGDCLDYFKLRFNSRMKKLNNEELVKGLIKEMEDLDKFANEAGGMESPVYKIVAVK